MRKRALLATFLAFVPLACLGGTLSSSATDGGGDTTIDGGTDLTTVVAPSDASSGDAAPGDAVADVARASDASTDAESDVAPDSGGLEPIYCDPHPNTCPPGLACTLFWPMSAWICLGALPALDLGKACDANADCTANLCTPVSGAPNAPWTCSQLCGSPWGDCPLPPTDAGATNWSCAPSPTLMDAGVCTCFGPIEPETCDGKDNDCNGTIDDAPTTDALCREGGTCSGGQCQ
jgi:hypothetical protein